MQMHANSADFGMACTVLRHDNLLVTTSMSTFLIIVYQIIGRVLKCDKLYNALRSRDNTSNNLVYVYLIYVKLPHHILHKNHFCLSHFPLMTRVQLINIYLNLFSIVIQKLLIIILYLSTYIFQLSKAQHKTLTESGTVFKLYIAHACHGKTPVVYLAEGTCTILCTMGRSTTQKVVRKPLPAKQKPHACDLC